MRIIQRVRRLSKQKTSFDLDKLVQLDSNHKQCLFVYNELFVIKKRFKYDDFLLTKYGGIHAFTGHAIPKK